MSAAIEPCSTAAQSVPRAAVASVVCQIVAVLDGHTIKCTDDRVARLLLVAAPTTTDNPQSEISRRSLEELAPRGAQLRLEFDTERDDGYHHTLGYAFLRDGRMLNEELARRGMVTLYAFPPNLRYVDRIRAAIRSARRAGAGIWRDSVGICPSASERQGLCSPF